jgi:uncharacterized membrane protein YdjX (TVP38/TMEM64 family)
MKNKKFWKIAAVSVAGVLVLLVVIAAWQPLKGAVILLSDQEAVSAVVKSYGALGPLVVILLHLLEILVAVIPGHFLMMASGYVYGFWWGFVLTYVTSVTISLLAFFLARIAGRPLVEKFAPKDSLDRWDGLTRRYGVAVIIIGYMLPVFSADVLNYVAGLSALSFWKFLGASIVGRIPGTVLMTLVGAYGFGFTIQFWAIFILGGILLLIVSQWVLKRLER